MAYTFFDKKFSASAVKSAIMSNQQLAEELHKPIIKKIEKRKAYSSFQGNIWGSHLDDMQLINIFNKVIRVLCAINVYCKYA